MENREVIELNATNSSDTIEKISEHENIVYYCAINEPIAEIVIIYYFSKFAKVEKVENLFKDDFSVNYKIEISVSLIDVHCLLCFMFMNKLITSPATFGIVLSDMFRLFDNHEAKTYSEKVFERSFENYKKQNPNATNEELNNFRKQGEDKLISYKQYYDNVNNVVEILKRKISADKYKIIEKYCRIYPLSVIEKQKYYVSHVPAKYIKQYIVGECPKYLYYYMFDNQGKYEKEYKKVILNLMEQGLVKSRWKNEYSLYLLVKSYFPSAIYQYRAEWLEKQSLDIYIPEYKLGIEYQGSQHYEAVSLFNGESGLIETQKRDNVKKEKCKLNGITLIEWIYTEKVEDQKLIDILKQQNIQIPPKQEMITCYIENNISKSDKKITEQELPLVCQYDLDGNYLNSFANVDSASKETGVSKDSIRRACSGVRYTGGGYMWRRYLVAEIPQKIGAYIKTEQVNGPRKIVQYSTSGDIIASYDSISEAVRMTGVNAKSIRETAKGKQNHAGGYVWKYEN